MERVAMPEEASEEERFTAKATPAQRRYSCLMDQMVALMCGPQGVAIEKPREGAKTVKLRCYRFVGREGHPRVLLGER